MLSLRVSGFCCFYPVSCFSFSRQLCWLDSSCRLFRRRQPDPWASPLVSSSAAESVLCVSLARGSQSCCWASLPFLLQDGEMLGQLVNFVKYRPRSGVVVAVQAEKQSGLMIALASTGDIGDMGSVPGSGRSSGGRHGNPPQYSRLEGQDRGAWQVPVHGITKSQT